MRKILFTLLLVVLGLTAKAQDLDYDFYVGNLYYRITRLVEFELAPMYQTNVTVHCVNYYKQ